MIIFLLRHGSTEPRLAVVPVRNEIGVRRGTQDTTDRIVGSETAS